MARLMYLLSEEDLDTLVSLKGRLKGPENLHRTGFVQWLESEARRIYRELVGEGWSHEAAVKEASVRLNDVADAWKAEARRRRNRRS